MLSNFSISRLIYILNSLSLKDLEYVYLSAGVNYDEVTEKLDELQEKILSLGEMKYSKYNCKTYISTTFSSKTII